MAERVLLWTFSRPGVGAAWGYVVTGGPDLGSELGDRILVEEQADVDVEVHVVS